jgi:hypothetical protein
MMRRNTGNFRSGERTGIPVVADNHDDRAPNPSGCAGVENALKGRPFMRGQNRDPQHRNVLPLSRERRNRLSNIWGFCATRRAQRLVRPPPEHRDTTEHEYRHERPDWQVPQRRSGHYRQCCGTPARASQKPRGGPEPGETEEYEGNLHRCRSRCDTNRVNHMSPWANLAGERARLRRQIITEDERPQPVKGHEQAWTEREEDDAASECSHSRTSRIGRSNWYLSRSLSSPAAHRSSHSTPVGLYLSEPRC